MLGFELIEKTAEVEIQIAVIRQGLSLFLVNRESALTTRDEIKTRPNRTFET